MSGLSAETIARLRIIAADETLNEVGRDLFGEASDDAYEWGVEDGEITLARTILKELDA